MTDIQTKRFPLRVVLTVTTGRLLTKAKSPEDNGIGDLYEILDWMTADKNFTHQIPRVGRECRPQLLEWFPDLRRADVRELDGMLERFGADGIEMWLESLSGMMAAEFDVPRLPTGLHERRHPVAEFYFGR